MATASQPPRGRLIAHKIKEPVHAGGASWFPERPGRFVVILAATESCEERDSPGIRPCGVTPAWPLSWGAGRHLDGGGMPGYAPAAHNAPYGPARIKCVGLFLLEAGTTIIL